MNLASSKDFMAVTVLMNASERIAEKVEGKYKLVQEFVGGHFRGLPASFWEEYFWRQMSDDYRAKREKMERDTETKDEEKELQEWIIAKIKPFSEDLWDWGLGHKHVKEWIKTMHGSNDLTDNAMFELMKSVDVFAVQREKTKKKREKSAPQKKVIFK